MTMAQAQTKRLRQCITTIGTAECSPQKAAEKIVIAKGRTFDMGLFHAILAVKLGAPKATCEGLVPALASGQLEPLGLTRRGRAGATPRD